MQYLWNFLSIWQDQNTLTFTVRVPRSTYTHTDIQIECAVIQVHMHNYPKYFLQFVFFFSFKSVV